MASRLLTKTKQPWLGICARCRAMIPFEVWLVQAPRVVRFLADPPARLVSDRLVLVPCEACGATVEVFLGPVFDEMMLGIETAPRTSFKRRARNPTFDGDVAWTVSADGTDWSVLLECGHAYTVREPSRPAKPDGVAWAFWCSECERMASREEMALD